MRVWNILASSALLCGSISAFAHAQGTPVNAAVNSGAAPDGGTSVPAAGTRVGVIDMGFVFDNHPSMKDQIAAIDAEKSRAEEEIEKRRQEILKQLEIIKTLDENTPNYKAQEEKIADAESKLKLDFIRKSKEIDEAKAKVVYETYKHVEAVTKTFAEFNQIGLVIRYTRTEMDPKKPGTVAQGINKDIVYFQSNLDLTEGVLNYIRQSAPAAVPAPNPVRNADKNLKTNQPARR